MLIQEINYKTVTINLEDYTHSSDSEIFVENIKLVHSINRLNQINKICKDIKSPFQANTNVVFKVMDSLLQDKPFTESELLEYFVAKKILEAFIDLTYKIIDYDNVYVSYESELHILGFLYSDFLKLESSKKEEICTAYGDLLNKNFSIETFIKEAKNLISNFKK